MKIKRLGSDIDDTIVDFYCDFKSYIKENYNLEIIPDKSFVDFWNLFGSKERTTEIIKKLKNENC